MEDENGLELSLGLSCGGSSSKSEGKNDSFLDSRTDEASRGSKTADDLKNFFHAGTQKHEPSNGTQKSESIKPQDNFFNDLSKAKEEGSGIGLNGREVWVSNNNKPAETGEDKNLELGNKRKSLFVEINHQKRREREADNDDSHEKSRPSHISITVDGSTAENEDVAESEGDNSSSRRLSHSDDGSKQLIGVDGSSEMLKEVHGFTDAGVIEMKRFNGSSENEFKLGNLVYGAPFSIQQVNMMSSMSYPMPIKESDSIGAPSTPVHPVPGMVQVMSAATTGAQPGSTTNVPLMFGYSPFQLPLLEKDNGWALGSHTQQIHSPYAGRGLPNSVSMQVTPSSSSEAPQYNGRPIERIKGDGKQPATEEGSSFQAEDAKGSSTNLREKDVSDQSTVEGLSLDFSSIKPGIGSDVKFGGCGSYPNLPWVNTTGPGPNGRTISGVTYRYSTNQIRIVCACHGSHMSPEEFVRHASEEHPNVEGGPAFGTISGGNHTASTHN